MKGNPEDLHPLYICFLFDNIGQSFSNKAHYILHAHKIATPFIHSFISIS